MRNWFLGFVTCLLGCASVAEAQPRTDRLVVVSEASGGAVAPEVVTAATWLGGAPVRSQLLVGSDGQTYVGLWIDAPAQLGVARRAPVALSLVIDNSGSMSGPKIEHARMAASSLIESLADGDIVSVYAFSNSVLEIAPPTIVDEGSRARLIQQVAGIVPMGGTNMFDGLRTGEARVAQAPPTHPVRRVVVISDGMANIGPSSPEALGEVAAQGTEYGAQVSAIGVGLQYDERTLSALAVRSAGRLYHLAQPTQMTAILREELQLLSSTVATDAYLEVEPAPGVELLGIESMPGELQGGRLRVRLGSLYGGQHRELLVRVRVHTTTPGQHALGTARLVFREPGVARAERTQSVGMQYAVTRDAAASQAVDARVQTMVATVQAAQAQLQAVQMLNDGQSAQAAQVLARAEVQLQQAAAAAPAPVRERATRQVEALRRGRASAAAATAPAQSRGVALEVNRSAYGVLGY
jgi:Ca-activated chloride channel family protein